VRIAPAGLALVQEVLNTRAVVPSGGTDLLASGGTGLDWLGATVCSWAAAAGFAVPGGEPVPPDLAAVRELRDRLVALVGSATAANASAASAANASAASAASAVAAVGGAEAAGPAAERSVAARLIAGQDGNVRLAPAAAGSWGEWLESAVWAETLLAQLDGTWNRLKLCREPACRSAFYDISRNNSGVWHDVRSCGNAANLRASRARKKQRAAEEDARLPR
jgi:predicted RNA-binding Zn ribbon-like protein